MITVKDHFQSRERIFLSGLIPNPGKYGQIAGSRVGDPFERKVAPVLRRFRGSPCRWFHANRVALAVVCLVTACTASSPHATTSVAATDRVGVTVFGVPQRRHVPDLAGTTTGGARLRLDTVIGHGVVVLNVWASWCAPCRAESHTLAALSTALAPRGVRFVGIDEQDSPARARAFAARAGVNYPSLSDSDGTLLAQLTELPSTGIPSTLVVDRNGLIAGRVIGAVHRGSLSRLISRVDSGR